MKTNQISRAATALAFASIAAIVSSCGSGSGSSSSGIVAPGIGGGGGASTPGACILTLTQNVGFAASNAQVTATQIYAAPNAGSAMTTTLTAGAYTTGYQYSNGWNTAVSDAYVGVNMAPIGGTTTSYGGYGASSYSVSGALTMTQTRWNLIVEELELKYPYGYTGAYGTTGSPYGYGYGTTPAFAAGQIPPGICISEIAFDLIWGPASLPGYSGYLEGGQIILYLNTQDTITLQL